MTPTSEEVERLMKRCQRGCGGRNALEDAHDILAECYGTLGALDHERNRLKNMLFKLGAMDQPPCFCCGYNGPGYYQPSQHKCAEQHHTGIPGE